MAGNVCACEINLTRELALSNLLAAEKELVTGSKVPSVMLQPEIRTLVELGHVYSSLFNFDDNPRDVNRITMIKVVWEELDYN